jgi:hypothetical protein
MYLLHLGSALLNICRFAKCPNSGRFSMIRAINLLMKRKTASSYLTISMLTAIVVVSCNDRYQGFENLDANHWMKLEALGDDANKVRDQKYMLMQIGLGDSTNEKPVHIYKVVGGITQLQEMADTLLRTQLGMMTKGEKRVFIIPYKAIRGSFFDVYPDSMLEGSTMLRLNVQVLQVFHDSTFVNYLMNAAQLGEISESEAIDQLFLNDREEVEEHGRIVLKRLETGMGDTVRAGREVCIQYHTYLLNGLQLDSLTTLTFPFGKSGQLLSGLQYGLSLLRQGDRALIYVPSDLAFGEKGSSTGIVPPRTPVYFDVSVLSVSKEGTLKP